MQQLVKGYYIEVFMSLTVGQNNYKMAESEKGSCNRLNIVGDYFFSGNENCNQIA